MSPNKYKQMLHKVIKYYKKAPPNLEADENKETNLLASKLKTEDRIEKFYIKNSFIILKNHKSDIRGNPACRLINPTKTQPVRLFCKIFELYLE